MIFFQSHVKNFMVDTLSNISRSSLKFNIEFPQFRMSCVVFAYCIKNRPEEERGKFETFTKKWPSMAVAGKISNFGKS